MLLKSLAFSCLLLAAPAVASADPTGTFDIKGVNTADGKDYAGTVTVVRDGETYNVSWTVGDQHYEGTGLGAHFKGDRFEMGPASADDTAISVGYISGQTFGMAMYFLQPDGTWQGVWTFAGSKKASAENWVPAK